VLIIIIIIYAQCTTRTHNRPWRRGRPVGGGGAEVPQAASIVYRPRLRRRRTLYTICVWRRRRLPFWPPLPLIKRPVKRRVTLKSFFFSFPLFAHYFTYISFRPHARHRPVSHGWSRREFVARSWRWLSHDDTWKTPLNTRAPMGPLLMMCNDVCVPMCVAAAAVCGAGGPTRWWIRRGVCAAATNGALSPGRIVEYRCRVDGWVSIRVAYDFIKYYSQSPRQKYTNVTGAYYLWYGFRSVVEKHSRLGTEVWFCELWSLTIDLPERYYTVVVDGPLDKRTLKRHFVWAGKTYYRPRTLWTKPYFIFYDWRAATR